MIERITTGLSHNEWKAAWQKIPTPPQGENYYYSDKSGPLSFEEWKQVVIAEGKNRQFVIHAVSGKRISLRQGVRQVIDEVLFPYAPNQGGLKAVIV